MFFCEDVILLVIILSHDDLLCSKEGSKIFVEVHFLLITLGIMANPKILWVSLKSNVEHAERED